MLKEHKKPIIYCLLVVLIALQLATICVSFSQKEGFHSDESWSYGFANSYYFKALYNDASSGEEINGNLSDITWFDSWQSGEVFHDYLTVQEGQQLDYGSVLYNQESDYSPPFHSLILHTVCSLFPESFSWDYAFAINLVAMGLTLIALFMLSRRLSGSSWVALLVVACYGFCAGAVNTSLYLRPYALLTCITAVYTLLHLEAYKREYSQCAPLLVVLGCLTFLGAYTSLYFLIYAFVIAAIFCLILAFRRKWGRMLGFGVPILAGAALMLVLWPMIFNMSSEGAKHNSGIKPLEQLGYFVNLILNETLGVPLASDYASIGAIAGFGLFLAVVILGGLLFLARRSPLGKKVCAKIKSFGTSFKTYWAERFKNPQSSVVFCVVVLLAIASTVVFVSCTVSTDTMGEYSDRYVMFVLPYVWMFAIFVLWKMAKRIPGKSQTIRAGFLVAICALLLVFGNATKERSYYFESGKTYSSTIEEMIAGNSAVVFPSVNWHAVYWAARLQYADNCFIFNADYSEDQFENLENVPESDDEVYLLLGASAIFGKTNSVGVEDKEDWQPQWKTWQSEGGSEGDSTVQRFLDYLKTNVSWINEVEYVGSESSFVGAIQVYRVVR